MVTGPNHVTRSKFIKARLLSSPPNLLWTILLGLSFVGAPTLLRWVADPILQGAAFSIYQPFIVFAALVLGWERALFVACAAALVVNYFFMEPRYVLFGNVNDTFGVFYFLFSCSLIIFVVDALKRAIIDLDEAAKREVNLSEELKHLNSELQHRVKNSLAVVQALSLHSFRGTTGSDDAVRKFQGRLHALAEAQAVLTSGKWELCQLPELATRALAPFNGQGAIRFAGPSCSLPEKSCVPLVLALHELGTNAMKYGALSRLEGVVEVSWQLRTKEGNTANQELVLDWVERGGPPVEPPSRRGLGSRLIAKQNGIDAATMDFRPEGLTCRIVAGGAYQTSDEEERREVPLQLDSAITVAWKTSGLALGERGRD
jgi:two-component sensor histidine kinase